MTHLDRHTARQARIRRISDGVVASYIHDIAPRRPAGDRAPGGSASRHDSCDAREYGSAVSVDALRSAARLLGVRRLPLATIWYGTMGSR